MNINSTKKLIKKDDAIHPELLYPDFADSDRPKLFSKNRLSHPGKLYSE